MYFDSLHQLIRMDGQGVYVWSAYGITLFVLINLIMSPLGRRRRALERVARRARRKSE